ncbi:universal stress protein [Massilia norwichensis]|uniref:Universal stress protein n=1 Tax=Massilia norwichensis TaxID=1442366 RepID=A0ABT2A5V0_9BURK|nr:universal stress protein [Massilia norwichensis]MCS0589558.1 universal stress protein [Massilia norwichensis]
MHLDFSRPGLPGLLLATDLSPRCDRPLERAKQLAAEFGAALEVLTVYESPQEPGAVGDWLDGSRGLEREAHAARVEIAQEFQSSGMQVNQRFLAGRVDDTILAAAAALPDYLVVTGSSRKETLGHHILGSTVERLARGLTQPLLVVRRRVRGSYANILVAIDGSPTSRLALRMAAAIFPGRRIVAFHAHVPNDLLESGAAQHDAMERFLDDCGLPPAVRAHIETVIAEGDPEPLLTGFARTNAVDLAVLGLHTEPALLRLLAGSRREHLLQDFSCDTMLVPAAP